MRKLGIALGGSGVVLIAVAVLLRFVILPSRAQLPSDTDKVRHYSGTASVLLNPAALASGDLTNVLLRDVPISIDRTVKVTKTDGQKALVDDARVVRATAGTTLSAATYTYAVDRKSLEPVKPFDNAQSVPDAALTVSWPIPAHQRDYTAYSVDTQSTVTAKYSGTEKVNGLATYVYKTALSPTTITDPKVLAGYPAQLPKSLLGSLPTALGLSPTDAAALGRVLSVMPDPVPISYLYSGQTTLWVAPDTGTVVSTTKTETRTAVLSVPGLPQPVPLAPVTVLSYTQTPQSVTEAVNDAKHDASRLTLIGVTLPLIGGIAGVVLVAAGVILLVRRRPPTAPVPGPEHERITPTPAH